MALELIAIATAAASAGVAEVTRRLLGRRKPPEPTFEPKAGPAAVSFGDVWAGGDVTQAARDIHHVQYQHNAPDYYERARRFYALAVAAFMLSIIGLWPAALPVGYAATLGPNSSVVWVNERDTKCALVATDGELPRGAGTNPIRGGTSYKITFAEPGMYTFACEGDLSSGGTVTIR